MCSSHNNRQSTPLKHGAPTTITITQVNLYIWSLVIKDHAMYSKNLFFFFSSFFTWVYSNTWKSVSGALSKISKSPNNVCHGRYTVFQYWRMYTFQSQQYGQWHYLLLNFRVIKYQIVIYGWLSFNCSNIWSITDRQDQGWNRFIYDIDLLFVVRWLLLGIIFVCVW